MSFECVLKCGKLCNSSDTITQSKWDSIQNKTKSWTGLDKFGDLYNSIQWDTGPAGHYIHKACYISLSSSAYLEKALQREKKRKELECANEISTQQETDEDYIGPKPSKCLRSSLGGPLHEKTKCVWCMEEEDMRHPKRSRGKLSRINTHSAWNNFKRHTFLIEDRELRERLTLLVESTAALSDPFANDIMYHHACWLKYITHANQNFTRSESSMHLQNISLSEARTLFFRHVDSVIFNEHEIRSLQSLLADYKRIISDFGYPVGDVKSSFLKDLLINEYKDAIGFKDRNEMNKSAWVYDIRGGGDYIEAAMSSLGINDEQLLLNVAPRLSQKIKEKQTIPWPPRIDKLEETENVCEMLLKFLTWLKNPKRKSADINPTTLSLASMITYYITGRRTTSVINMGISVHGMTRSKDLVQMLHKTGMSISYADTLFLYDHWALMDVDASATCPQEIADQKPAIVIVDNDDFKIDTMTGTAAGAHRTNVMFVQPKHYEKKANEQPVPKLNKKETTQQLKQKSSELTEVRQYKCPYGSTSEPPVRQIVDTPLNDFKPQQARSVIHALSRVQNGGMRPSPDSQSVPAYSGSQSCRYPPVIKSKPYFHTTYNEPPSKSVLNDIMVKLEAAMLQKSIPFSFLVGDLPTYKTVIQLKAENPQMFNNIIPMLGAFHQQMSYMYAVYKRFKESGIADVLVAAGVVVEGSVEQALRGKHYRRGVRCILLWREALIHQRLLKLLEDVHLTPEMRSNLDILRNPHSETQEALAKAYTTLENDNGMIHLIKKVYEKPCTSMGDFWISFLEMTDPLVQNIDACHTQNALEYLSSTYDMLPGLMAYDNHDYGRYLPDYWAMISSLADDQMTYFGDHFAQSMTGLPYSCQPMDLWIETTMNLNSKLKQGWLHILQNDKQLFSTTRNANNVARVKAAVKRTLKCKPRHRKHVECQPARMKKDEQAIQDLQACITEFDANPFDESKPTLRTLQSGLIASSELILDLKMALEVGQRQAETLLQKRVFTKTQNLSATIHKNKRRNFSHENISAQSDVPIKVAQMEKSGLAALLDLAEGSGIIQLDEALEGRVTEECLSMYNVDGSMRKTSKSLLLQLFQLNPVLEKPHDFISIVDMGLIWRLATPNSEDRETRKRDGSEYRWNDYLDKILSIIISRHTNARKIILVNDRYDLPFSIKDDEHDRRASKHGHIPAVYPKPEDNFPGAAEFNKVMTSSPNKVRLQGLVKEHIKTQANRVPCEMIYCVGQRSTNLSNGMDDTDFVFQHTEADTMLISACAKIRASDSQIAVVLDSEDTDVYVQAVFVAHKLEGELFMKRKNEFINCRAMLSADVANIIIPLHIITGSDHTSGFYGHGKKRVLKNVINDPEARQLLMAVGDNITLEEDVESDMRTFVISKIYGDSTSVTCGQARSSRWHKLKKKNTVRLPPDNDSLKHHIKRTNFITYCQKHYNMQDHPSPINNGWEIINGKCRPVRYTVPPLPLQLNQGIQPDEDCESSDDGDDDSSDSDDSTDSYE